MADRKRPAAATGDADAESGTAGGDDRREALAALEVMRRRGLIDEATYLARKREIEAG
ncbi:hypothetical protein [Inquilinus sp.]|jgi:hypothetical protein|uniref:hypothetical protein n=1 Tax=Inquilinus sp. TaxID=1932117 RepID=UPI003784A7B1